MRKLSGIIFLDEISSVPLQKLYDWFAAKQQKEKIMKIIAYTYESDHHCADCTRKRFTCLPVNGRDCDENGVDIRAADTEGNLLCPVFDTDESPPNINCCGCNAEITERAKRDQIEEWKKVRKLWADWKYLEAADRGFDMEACSSALSAYSKAMRKYEAEFALPWGVDDVLIEISGGCFREAHNLAPGQQCVVVDYDNLEG